MYSLFLSLVLVAVTGTSLFAQQVRPAPTSRLYADLLKLNSLTSVLYLAAHPDDENTRLLSWLATGQHIRTAYLSLTRGDGGQNILGPVQGAGLGLIRTHELMAARGLDGAGQYFSRAIDFGYSKTAEETFKHWDADQLTADVISVINEFRPDIVICRFPASRMAGHGQHEASTVVAKMAFDACPSEFRPKRLLFNAYSFGSRSTIEDGMFSLDVGQYDPLIGMGYGELAGMSRSLHKSQGAGTRSTPGIQAEYFETLGGEPPTNSLFSGIDTTWSRIGRKDIGEKIDMVIADFYKGSPSDLIQQLLDVRSAIATIADPHWRRVKTEQINSVLLSAMGITADISVSQPHVVAGQDINASLRVVSRAGRNVTLSHVNIFGSEIEFDTSLIHDVLFSEEIDISIPDFVIPTNPYWLEKDSDEGLFRLSDNSLLGLPTTPSQLPVKVLVMIGEEEIAVSMNLSYKWLDPLNGDVIEELRIVPPVSVEPLAPLVLRTPDGLNVSVRIRAYAPVQNATLKMRMEGGSEMTMATNISMRANTDTLITFSPTVTTAQTIELAVETGASRFDRAVNVIEYDHLPTLQYLERARVKVVPENIGITAKRVAFIAGAGEITPDVLRNMGVTVDEISDEEILQTEDMMKYDAVLVGVRAMNTRSTMKYLMPALMTYVERGGTLVMQYNTAHRLSTNDIGPYPLELSRGRVTEEDAEVTFLQSDHILFSKPNRITSVDFDNWVQERGLYFTAERSPEYTALLQMHDTGEEPLDGSLLYAKYGKGHYVYCSLSLFRQLPAGVPGGLKLLANMLSVGK